MTTHDENYDYGIKKIGVKALVIISIISMFFAAGLIYITYTYDSFLCARDKIDTAIVNVQKAIEQKNLLIQKDGYKVSPEELDKVEKLITNTMNDYDRKVKAYNFAISQSPNSFVVDIFGLEEVKKINIENISG